MEKLLPRMHSFLNAHSHGLGAAVMSVLFALVVSGSALAQEVTVSGTVTTAAGVPLPGVTVRVQGTDVRTFSDANGKYRVSAPADATLTFAHVGEKLIAVPISGRTTVDATMTAISHPSADPAT